MSDADDIAGRAMRISLGASPAAAVPLAWIRRLFNSPVRKLRTNIRGQIGAATTDPVKILEMIIGESDLKSYEWRAVGNWWGRSYYLLGAPAAVLGATAGGAALSNMVDNLVVGALALAAAALTTLATFLRSDQNRDRCTLLSAEWASLGSDARLVHLRYASSMTIVGSSRPMEIENEIMRLDRKRGAVLRREVFDRTAQLAPADATEAAS
jgi:hypothetical protein